MTKQVPFIHLHNHTQYSLLDGALHLSRFVKTAQKMKMQSLAITDHGNMFGAIHFYEECIKNGIKPIIGCEVYIAPASRFEKKTFSDNSDLSYHLILLAQNEIGYKNLIKLVTDGYFEGFYYKPRIDKELLKKYSKGLICLSGCLKGE
ncbi:MAG: PHP domain-containing protein, partial [bacterium]